MPDQILTYFRKHKQIIEENLILCEDPADIEAIHNLRLSVKRLRVVGKLADMFSEQSFGSKKRMRAINKLFKSSGRLRDIQVTLQLLKDTRDTSLLPLIEKFEKKKHKQRLKFENALQVYEKGCLDELETGLTNILTGIKEKQALQAGHMLLAELEMKVHDLYHGSNGEKRMHDIRTRLKEIIYLNNIFDEQLPLQEQLNISIERLREVGEIAGTWHDCLNLEEKLGKYLSKKPADTVSIQHILSELKIRKEDLHQEYCCILINEMKV